MTIRRREMRKLLGAKLNVDITGKSKRELLDMLSPEDKADFLSHFKHVEKKERAEKREEKSGKSELKDIFAEASNNAEAKALACSPKPMAVQQHKNSFDDSSPVEKEWLVAGGVCGFGYVHLTNGRSKASRYAKEYFGAKPHYDRLVRRTRGVSIPAVPKFSKGSPLIQSYEINMAWAKGFADVLVKHGIEARADGWVD